MQLAVVDLRICVTASPSHRSESSARARASPPIHKGDTVRVEFDMSRAIELAAYGVGDEEKAMGERFLAAIQRGERVLYDGEVVFPPPDDRTDDPLAPVCVRIDELVLDDSENLFVIPRKAVLARRSSHPA